MTTQSAPAGTSPALSAATPTPASAPPSWAWRRGALFLAGTAGGILHPGLFFIPALVVLAVGSVQLWRERSGARREV